MATAGGPESEDGVCSWALLPDDIFQGLLRISHDTGDGVRSWLSAAATCRAWRRIAEADALWTKACQHRWPEVLGLINVGRYSRCIGA